jgi:hypothetical protein
MPEYIIEKGIDETMDWYVAEFAPKQKSKPEGINCTGKDPEPVMKI